jgi:hypothetical protein
MGIFSKIKQFGQQMEAASQQMMNTQLAVTIDNSEVKIGQELSGNITITSRTPCSIQGFQVNLFRELAALETAGQTSDKKQWVFNKENIQTPLQIQGGETKTVPFRFIVKDGVEFQPTHPDVFGKVTPVGLNPAVIPDPKDGVYNHKLVVTAQLEGAPIGPTGGVDNVMFVYPSLNPGISLSDNR